MEPITIFAAAVAFVGTFHLLSTAVNNLGKNRNMRVACSSKKREDWYCFFHMADLLGQDAAAIGEADQTVIRDEDRIDQKRRQEARRPRVYA